MRQEWENKYRKLLNNEKISYSEVGEKIEKYRPLKLYRYMKFDDFWEKNILEGQLFLSPAIGMNDPFDCLIYVNHKEYLDHMFELMKKIFPKVDNKIIRQEVSGTIDTDMDKLLLEIKKTIRIACFSEDYLSPLMWAHYADSHKGFCIEYDLSKLPDGYRNGILPVLYSDQRYEATRAFITRNGNILMNPYYFKSSHWKYEKEWRMVAQESLFTNNEYYADFSIGINAVYIGLRSEETHGDKVRSILEQCSIKQISVYKMAIEPCSYNLKRIKLN